MGNGKDIPLRWLQGSGTINGDETLHRLTGLADVDLLALVGHAQFLRIIAHVSALGRKHSS